MKQRKILIIASLCILAAAFLTACGAESGNGLTRESRPGLLGTVISISGYEDMSRELYDEAFAIVGDIDDRMSFNRQDSEIARINAGSGGAPVSVSGDTYGLIEWSLEFSELSGGAFDVSIGAVTELWKSGGAFCVRPADSEIKERLSLVDYRSVALSEGSVFLEKAGMKLDLGAIAKGYACDSVLEHLKEQNIAAALLDFGGNIYAHGTKPDGSDWVIGIKSPVIGENGVACTISVKDAAVVTSGGYERYFEEDGTVYHHIIDPKTGYSASSGLLSVTIIDPSSTRADALSTACYILGLEEGLALLQKTPSGQGIFITEDLELYLTPGLEGAVTVLDGRFIPAG